MYVNNKKMLSCFECKGNISRTIDFESDSLKFTKLLMNSIPMQQSCIGVEYWVQNIVVIFNSLIG